MPPWRWPHDLSPELVTTRLVLEPLAVGHAAGMVEVLSSPALYTVIGGSPPSLAELTARYARQVAGPAQPGERRHTEQWCNWVLRAGPHLVGYVQATLTFDPGAVAPRPTAVVAWVVRPPDQGRGLATEAAAAMVQHLWARGVTAVTAWISDTHPASQAVARRIGLAPTDQCDESAERLWSARSGSAEGHPQVCSDAGAVCQGAAARGPAPG